MMVYLKRIATYWKRLFVGMWTKVTTYCALATAAAVELPNAVSQDSLNALHLSEAMLKHVVMALAALTIWARMRRLIKTPPSA